MDLENFEKLTMEKLLFPLLKYAENGEEIALKDAEDHLAKIYGLTSEQRFQKKPKGHGTTFMDKIFWARLYLKSAGLISYPKKSYYKITDKGKKFLEESPGEITTKILGQYFPEFVDWKNKIKARKKLKIKKYPSGRGVVVLFDALGTKGITGHKSKGKIIEEWEEFIQTIDNELKVFGNDYTLITFSDTIIITVITKEIEQTLHRMSEILSRSVVKSMLIDRPIRGCISAGDIIVHKSLVIGNAIEEASMYSEMPNWIGISASPSVNFIIENLNKKDSKNVNLSFRRFDIPLRESVELSGWAINWPYISDAYVRENYEKNLTTYQTTEAILDEKLQTAKLQKMQDVGVSLKWRNTRVFFESYLKQ